MAEHAPEQGWETSLEERPREFDWKARALAAEAELRELRGQQPVAKVTSTAEFGGGSHFGVQWLKPEAMQAGATLYSRPIPSPAVPEEWIERWYGSGEAKDIGVELCRGSHIYTKNTREHIAFLGDTDVAHELCTEIVLRHNQSLLQSAGGST